MSHQPSTLGRSHTRALIAVGVTPGVQVSLSVLLEDCRPWRDQYPAVLLGDPLLALAIGLGTSTARADARPRFPRRPVATVVTIAAAAFGAWQGRREVESGIYTPPQAGSPSKLWHQFVVYPVLANLLLESLWTGAASVRDLSPRERQRYVAAWAAVCVWAVLAFGDARPRAAHGAFDWSRLRVAAAPSASPRRISCLGSRTPSDPRSS